MEIDSIPCQMLYYLVLPYLLDYLSYWVPVILIILWRHTANTFMSRKRDILIYMQLSYNSPLQILFLFWTQKLSSA